MRVLFLHKYGEKAASYRYRFAQYFSFLEKNDIQIVTQSLFDDEYLKEKFSGQSLYFLNVFKAFWRRLKFIILTPKTDLVVLYKDLLPYLPFFIEYALLLNRNKYIVDLDDAIYLKYKASKNPLTKLFLAKKFDLIFKNAACVFAGNSNLALEARKYNKNTLVMPTVVDLNYYRNVKNFTEKKETLTIGWMGSPSTAISLFLIRDALNEVSKRFKVKFCIVGSGPIDLNLNDLEIREWKLSNEISDLMSFDIGIMPLENDEWSRGKCGFKLIQYMACGIPVVGSPVGVNCNIIDHGTNGFLANSQSEWIENLEKLLRDSNALLLMGQAARQTVKAKYSLEATAEFFAQQVFKAAGGNDAQRF